MYLAAFLVRYTYFECVFVQAVVRVIDSDGERSKWSHSFSLDAVGAEGVFACSWESSKAPRQVRGYFKTRITERERERE